MSGCASWPAGPIASGAASEVAAPSDVDTCSPPASSGSSEMSLVSTAYRPPNDWAWLCKYRQDNARLVGQPRPDVLFMGDSITEFWIKADGEFFEPRRVNRGIAGQTSAQMLLRFYADAVALRPRVLHLLAGTNDIAKNDGAMGQEAYRNNMRAMVELAQASGVTVVVGSILPANSFHWRPGIQPTEEIRATNTWLRAFAVDRRIQFIDYYAAMATPDGRMREGLSDDGVHPNAAGYRVMREVAEPVLRYALTRAGRPGT
jgi:lysophospholipase L1-like esterase